MARALLAMLVVAVLLPAGARAATVLPPGFSDSTVWRGMDAPTALRFAPDGRVFVAGKGGLVYVFDRVDDTTPSIYADLRTHVHHGWDRGMLGLAVDAAGRVFVAYTYDKDPNSPLVPRWNDGCPTPPGFADDGCTVGGRLSRLDADGTEHVLIEDFCEQYPSHSVGTLAFGPDGMLYMSAGDGAHYKRADYGQSGDPPNPCGDPPGGLATANAPPTARGGALRAQSFRRPAGEPVSLDGTIIRVDPETGAAAFGNPASGSTDPQRRRIVAYGLRNPFRFAFRPGTDEIWAGDVGWGAWEEIDRVPDLAKVRNYGWPCYEGPVHQDSYDALDLDQCTSLYGQGAGAVVKPYFTYRHSEHVAPGDPCPVGSSSLSGMAFYTGGKFPPVYNGALFFSDYSRGCIWVMYAGADGLPDPATRTTFAAGDAGAVDLQIGPDGALYFVDVANGSIRRIAVSEPVARIAATPAGGVAPLHVSFDGTDSSDAASYAWDLDGDGSFDDSTDPRPTFTYTRDGPLAVRLRVTDPRGSTGTAATTIAVGTPPAATIDAPAPGTTWAVGDTIAFAGTASAGASVEWGLEIHHCSGAEPSSCHVHHVQDFSGASGSFLAPDHEYPSYLVLTMTATAADRLTTTRSVRLDPRTAELTLTSSPPGLRLAFAGETAATPFTRTVIACSATSVTAASPQSLGAATYAFAGWGDGYAQSREVRARARGGATYAAAYDAVADGLLAGTESVGVGVSERLPGAGEAYATTATATGPAMALRLRLDASSTASKLVLGLYTDAGGEASALLGTGTLNAPVAGAWNEARLDRPVSLVAGRRYWIALLNPLESAGVLRWRDRAGAPDLEHTSQSNLLSALPPWWATNFAYVDGGPASATAVGPPAGAPLTGRVDAGPCDRTEPVAPSSPPPPAPQKPAPAKTLPLTRVPAKLRLNRGTVALRLSCPAASSCRFNVTIARVGRITKTVRAGGTVTVHVKASARARRLLRRHHRLKVRVTITRRAGAASVTVARYALISGRAGSVSRATSAA